MFTENVQIKVSSKEEESFVLRLLEQNGYMWGSGAKPTELSYFVRDFLYICVDTDKSISRCSTELFRKTVLASELIKPLNTMELKVGQVVHVQTQEEYNTLMQAFEKLGYKWSGMFKATSNNIFSTYQSETCVGLYTDRNLSYCSKEWFIEDGIVEIIPFKTFMKVNNSKRGKKPKYEVKVPTFSESFKKMIKESDGKIFRILQTMLKYPNFPIWESVFTQDIDYLTVRNNGLISYLPKGKEHQVNEDGTWKRDGRQEASPSKVMRKLFNKKIRFKDIQFEEFTNMYKSKNAEVQFKLLSNEEIPEVYCMDRVESGTLSDSCMNGDSQYLDIYKYCKDLQILIALNKDGLLMGRALVWKIDDITFMDRIYVCEDHLYNSFIEYCEDNKWWRKRNYKSYDDRTKLINPQGEEVNKVLRIELDTDHDQYPYIDTFHYGGDGWLSNDGGEYVYNQTDGCREGDNKTWDEIDECYIDGDDARYIERGRYSGCYTHYGNIVDVDGDTFWCDDDRVVYINGEYYDTESDDVCYSEYVGEYLLREDCMWSDHHNDYLPSDDCIEVEDDWYLTDSVEIVEVEGTWYLKSNEDITEIDGEYFLTSKLQEHESQ